MTYTTCYCLVYTLKCRSMQVVFVSTWVYFERCQIIRTNPVSSPNLGEPLNGGGFLQVFSLLSFLNMSFEISYFETRPSKFKKVCQPNARLVVLARTDSPILTLFFRRNLHLWYLAADLNVLDVPGASVLYSFRSWLTRKNRNIFTPEFVLCRYWCGCWGNGSRCHAACHLSATKERIWEHHSQKNNFSVAPRVLVGFLCCCLLAIMKDVAIFCKQHWVQRSWNPWNPKLFSRHLKPARLDAEPRSTPPKSPRFVGVTTYSSLWICHSTMPSLNWLL